MTVEHIKLAFSAAFALILLACIALVVLFWSWLFLAVALVSILILFVLYVWLMNFFMMKRLRHVALTLLDPFLLGSELDQAFQTEAMKKSYLFHVFEALRCSMLGDFSKALEIEKSVKHKNPLLNKARQSDLAYYYIQTGDMSAAEACLPCCEELLSIRRGAYSKPMLRASMLHTLGLYHLRKGDLAKARGYFDEASACDPSASTLLHIQYDLAELEELEGKPERAIELLKQAAALGPKTWLAEAAAKRLAAYGIELSDSRYARYMLHHTA